MRGEPLEQIRSLVENESGIKLGPEKTELLINRLRKRLRALGLTDEKQYLEIIESDLHGEELVNLIDVVSTNYTYFYREPQHFHHFEKLLREKIYESSKEIRVWCAASSSGEEPYFLSMISDRVLSDTGIQLKILATDISTHILRRAIRGVYGIKQVEKLPDEYLNNYFERSYTDGEATFSVVPRIKDRVVYKKFNLAKFPYPLKGPIDFIFCRNVMIYFDLNLRQSIISEMERLLSPTGVFYISHSENLLGINHGLKSLEVGAYCKK